MYNNQPLALVAALSLLGSSLATPVADPEPEPVADPRITVGPTASILIGDEWAKFLTYFYDDGPPATAVDSVFREVAQDLSDKAEYAAWTSFRGVYDKVTLNDFVNNPNPTPLIAPQISDLPASLQHAYELIETVKFEIEHSIAIEVATSVMNNGVGGGFSAFSHSAASKTNNPFASESFNHHHLTVGGGGNGGHGGSGQSATHFGSGGQHEHTTHPNHVTVFKTVTPSSSGGFAPSNTGATKAAGLALGAIGAAVLML